MKLVIIKLYLIHHKGKPLKSVDGECLVFDKLRSAQAWIRKAREKGDVLFYGDEVKTKDLRIINLPHSLYI